MIFIPFDFFSFLSLVFFSIFADHHVKHILDFFVVWIPYLLNFPLTNYISKESSLWLLLSLTVQNDRVLHLFAIETMTS